MRDKEPKNEYGDPHGQWICYKSDGTLWFMDHNINGVEYGYGTYQEHGENGELTYVKEYYAR